MQVSSLAAVIEARATPKAGEAPRPPPLPRAASLSASVGGLDPPPRLHLGKLGAYRARRQSVEHSEISPCATFTSKQL